MDAERFDGLARSLSRRLSRRAAVGRSVAGAAATVIGLAAPAAGLGRAALQTSGDWYVVVRRYEPTGTIDQVRQTLQNGYAPRLSQQPGFLEYAVLASGGSITSITTFETQAQEEAAAQQLADWVQQNLAPLLPLPDAEISGLLIVHAADPVLCQANGAVTPTPTNTPSVPPTMAPATATSAATATSPAGPTALPVCTDPARPGVGCACITGTLNPCGQTTLVCCKNDPNGPPGAPGTCTPASVGCSPLGPTPTPTAEAACTDVGCPCTAGVEGTCAPGLVCCQSQMTAPNYPGGPGMCATQDGCGGGEPPVCRTAGCRCNGGVQDACEADLLCCPDDPGVPGGPGRCAASDQCNQNGCTGAGCGCLSGVQGACDDGLICCADDPSLPGGPGRCQDEATCLANQCQATTNPCPSACGPGAYCAGCCSGYCGADGHCGSPPCSGIGCECMAGVEGACDAGLVCCQSQMNGGVPGGPGQCAAPDACGGAGASAPAADTTTAAQPASEVGEATPVP
ncbi:MAG TPA: hypothetical protein VFQ80_06380 [Thermomicrobiales bacterium]|nr:hypothetical protein [Thermomicrobiales bacterium]